MTWQTKKLGEVCEITTGSSNTVDAVSDGKYVFFDRSKTIKRSNKFLFDSKALIIPGEGAEFFPKYYFGKFNLHQRAYALLNFHKDTSINFVKYFLIFNHKYFEKVAVGATVKSLRRRHFTELEIPLPLLPEQKRIVKILDEAFEKIEKAKENAEKNLKNSKELFESYLQSVFANPGNGWEEKTLGGICDFVRGPFGGSLKKNIFKKEGYVVYEQQHAIYGQFDDVRYFIDEKKFNEMKRFELKSGDLIMSCSGTMGKIAIAPQNIKQGIINQALLKLSPSKNLFNTFLKYWMESGVFQNDLKIYTKGAAIKNVVSVKILKEIKIILPKIEEQKNIVKKLDSLSEQTKKLGKIYQKKLEDLEELKKSVLNKAFKGEL